MNLVPDFYLSAIRTALPDIDGLTRPTVRGALNATFIATTPRGKFVCKFNHRDMAKKNAKFSQIMTQAGVAVPVPTVHEYKDYWFEMYPMMPGKTLYECMENKQRALNVIDIYEEVMQEFVKMTTIPSIATLGDIKFKHIHQVAYRDVSYMTSPIVAPLFAGAVRAMNMTGGHKGLYHCGITPKNIIVSDTNKFVGLVDLDDVAVAERDYAFGVMATQYANMGYRPNDLIDIYEGIQYNNDQDERMSVIDAKSIKRMERINNADRWLMWKHTKARTK